MSKIDVNTLLISTIPKPFIIPPLSLLIFLILLFSCKNTPKETVTEEVPPPPEIIEEKKAPSVVEIYVWVDRLRLRAEANTKSDIITELKEGQALIYLEERSDFTEKISMRGTLFDEPWLKVKTKDNQEGWVYGGGVKFYKIGVDKAPSPYDDCFKLQKDRKNRQAEKCFERVQFRQLKEDGTLVEAMTDGIRFRLQSGDQISLTNVGRDTTYSYRYYMKNMGIFVVFADYSQSEGYVFIDDRTGKMLFAKGFPKASADGNYIACVNADESKEGFNGIQLLGYVNRALDLIYEKELEDFIPVMPKWIDSKTLQFTLLEKGRKNNRVSRHGQLVLKENGVWELEI